MSDTSAGPGWWQASDGKWYPPELHADHRPPATPESAGGSAPPGGPNFPPPSFPPPDYPPPNYPPPGVQSPDPLSRGVSAPGSSGQRQPGFKRIGFTVALVFVLLVAVVGVVARVLGGGDDENAEGTSGVDVSDAAADVSDAAADESDAAVDDELGDAPADEDETAPPGAEADLGTRDAPFPLGVPVDLDFDQLGRRSEWTLVVTGTGVDYWPELQAENPFNDPPSEGMVYFAVPIELTLRAADEEPVSPFWVVNLDYYGPASRKILSRDSFDDYCGVTPNEFGSFDELFAGGSASGVICYAAPIEDVDAGILLSVSTFMGSDRWFFATQ